jgi:hypothetical protein|tara:strand:- start:3390 stop:3956 length:567 start_codon:yes stop_codon:yes gene_type:complete
MRVLFHGACGIFWEMSVFSIELEINALRKALIFTKMMAHKDSTARHNGGSGVSLNLEWLKVAIAINHANLSRVKGTSVCTKVVDLTDSAVLRRNVMSSKLSDRLEIIGLDCKQLFKYFSEGNDFEKEHTMHLCCVKASLILFELRWVELTNEVCFVGCVNHIVFITIRGLHKYVRAAMASVFFLKRKE